MQRRTRYIEHILSNEFLPHQGLDASSEVQHRKATFLAVIVCKLLRVPLEVRAACRAMLGRAASGRTRMDRSLRSGPRWWSESPSGTRAG